MPAEPLYREGARVEHKLTRRRGRVLAPYPERRAVLVKWDGPVHGAETSTHSEGMLRVVRERVDAG